MVERNIYLPYHVVPDEWLLALVTSLTSVVARNLGFKGISEILIFSKSRTLGIGRSIISYMVMSNDSDPYFEAGKTMQLNTAGSGF